MFYEIWFKMDEDLTIVNQNTRNESITSFLKKNLKKIILILFSLIIFLIFLFIYQELKERKKNRLAEKYNNIILKNREVSLLGLKFNETSLSISN